MDTCLLVSAPVAEECSTCDLFPSLQRQRFEYYRTGIFEGKCNMIIYTVGLLSRINIERGLVIFHILEFLRKLKFVRNAIVVEQVRSYDSYAACEPD
eukprot:376498-Prorocentrum_minimum.AAC.4